MLSLTSATNINFTARRIGEVKILRENKPYMASLVSFDLKEQKDISKINEICHTENFKTFGIQLYNDLNRVADYPVKDKYCFALVKNTEENFSDINHENVLGIFTTYDSHVKELPVKIAYFMTNKNYRCDQNKFSEFKEIGRGMFNAIRKIFPDKSLSLYSALDAVKFWIKMGFKQITDRNMIFKI